MLSDPGFTRRIAGLEAEGPVPPAGGRAVSFARKLLQEQARVADCRDVRHAVQACLLAAAISGDQRGRAAHMVAVIQAEIGWHPSQDHAIGLLQGLAALVPELKRVLGAKKPPRHAREVDGNAEPADGAGDPRGIVRPRKRLAADDGEGALRVS